MTRYAAILEYDGTQFHGWQSQTNLRNVQDCTEHALSKVANHAMRVFCAGRTDVGVHASGQVIHFISDAKRSIEEWQRGVNTLLPKDIAIQYLQVVDDTFHARFSARFRSYRYTIVNAPERPVLNRNFCTWIYKTLNVSAMHQAAQALLGEHDFSSFRAAGCQSKSPIRRVSMISVERQDERIVINITANAFVQHMVRNIVGALIAIGSGKAPVEWIAQLLPLRDRRQSAVTAPSCGLCLYQVTYPMEYGLPARQ